MRTQEVSRASAVSPVSRRSEATPRAERPSKASQALVYAPPLVALPALGLGVAGLLGRGPALLRRHPVLSAALACGGMAVLAKSQLDRFFLEQPDYEVVERLNGLEVRLYTARNVAETIVNASSFDEARSAGFQRLADYLFGANVPAEKLALTAPASLGRNGSGRDGERLSMTTPVTLAAQAQGYVMRFQMPKDRELGSLPRPTDPRITLRRLPEELVAVLRFRGSYDGELIAERQREFLYRMEAAGLVAGSEPTFAGYDSPAALPPLRRVEIWATVA